MAIMTCHSQGHVGTKNADARMSATGMGLEFLDEKL